LGGKSRLSILVWGVAGPQRERREGRKRETDRQTEFELELGKNFIFQGL